MSPTVTASNVGYPHGGAYISHVQTLRGGLWQTSNVDWNRIARRCNLYVTFIMSTHPHLLTHFVYKSDSSMRSPTRQLRLSATTTLPAHQDPRTRSDKADFHVQCLKNVFSSQMVLVGCYHLSLAGDLDMFVVFVVLCLVRLPLFPPFPDVSTEGANKYIGFIAYAMANQSRRIMRRVEAEHDGYCINPSLA